MGKTGNKGNKGYDIKRTCARRQAIYDESI